MTAEPEIPPDEENAPMSREAAIAALMACQELASDDPQLAHVEADDVLRRFLISLGHRDVVEEFDKAINWFV